MPHRLPPFLSPRELQALLDRTERSIQRDLLRVIRQVQLRIPLTHLEQAILERNLEKVIETIGLEPVQNALARAQTSIQAVREAGWSNALNGLPPKVLTLNTAQISLGAHAQQSPYVLEAIRRQDLSRIKQITTETREAIRYRLEAGLQLGEHPTVVARKLRETVGLNRNQARIVERFQRALTAEGRDPAQIERMTARKAQQLATVRAENISVTETMRALSEGKQAQWKRLVEERVIVATDWETEWVTAADERTCPICLPLHGDRVPIGGTFSTSEGALTGPPAHPRCRCVTRLTGKDFRKGQRPAPARDRILAGLRG